jgi:predicted phosphodiesterase
VIEHWVNKDSNNRDSGALQQEDLADLLILGHSHLQQEFEKYYPFIDESDTYYTATILPR